MEYSMQCVNVVRIIIYLIILFFNYVNSQNTVCESGYCYELQTESADWLEAQRLCVNKGMTLSDRVPQQLDITGVNVWTNRTINGVVPDISAGTCMQFHILPTPPHFSMSNVPCYGKHSYICQTDYPRECLLSEKGNEYMGTVSTSSENRTCLHWTSFSKKKFPDGNATNAKNYCRNPDNSFRPWCYINLQETFKYCNIPSCVNQEGCFSKPFEYDKDVLCSKGKCYIFVDGSVHGTKNWIGAERCCSNLGGTLIEQQINVIDILELMTTNYAAWITVNDLGHYTKTNGSTRMCPYTTLSAGVLYEDCGTSYRFICKRAKPSEEVTTISQHAETDKDDSQGPNLTPTPSAPVSSSSTVSQSPTTTTTTTPAVVNPAETKDTQQTNTNIIIYALVGAVVLLVAIIVFVIAIVCVRKKRATKKSQETANEPTVFFHNDVYERGDAVNNQYTTHIPQSVYTAPKNNVYAEHQDNVYLKDNVYNNAKDNYAYSSAQKDDTYSSPYKQDQLSHYATADTDYTKNSMAASQLSHHENSKNEMASHLDQDKVHTAGLDPVTNPMYSVNPISESTYSIPDKSLKRRKEANMPSGVQNTQPTAEPVYAEPPTLPIRNY